MRSCIYEGTVSHRRLRPVEHKFKYRLFMVYLDLEELPSLTAPGGLIPRSRYCSRSFLRDDHLFERRTSLEDEVRSIVTEQTGEVPKGPIRLLTQLRYFSVYFSPLNLFYVFDEEDHEVRYVVAEVSNTPWRDRHCYVLWSGNRQPSSKTMSFTHAKEFHVSPFMSMAVDYRWKLTPPTDQLQVQVENHDQADKLFDAAMALERRELSRRQLRRMTVRYPLMTAKISAAIYIQALKLWWKKCPVYTHPSKAS